MRWAEGRRVCVWHKCLPSLMWDICAKHVPVASPWKHIHTNMNICPRLASCSASCRYVCESFVNSFVTPPPINCKFEFFTISIYSFKNIYTVKVYWNGITFEKSREFLFFCSCRHHDLPMFNSSAKAGRLKWGCASSSVCIFVTFFLWTLLDSSPHHLWSSNNSYPSLKHFCAYVAVHDKASSLIILYHGVNICRQFSMVNTKCKSLSLWFCSLQNCFVSVFDRTISEFENS